MKLKSSYKCMSKMLFRSSIVLCIIIAAIMIFSIIMTTVGMRFYQSTFTPEGVAKMNALSGGECTYTLVDPNTIVIENSDGSTETIYSVDKYVSEGNTEEFTEEEGSFSVSGMESAVMIFLFVSGIVLFKQNLYLGFANGISRKTTFVSTVLIGATYSVALMIAYYIISVLGTSALSLIIAKDLSLLVDFVTVPTFIQNVVSAFNFFVFGLFIGGLYYRMNKPLKIIVSVGVPITLFVILPATLGYLSSVSPKFAMAFNNIGTAIVNFMSVEVNQILLTIVEIVLITLLGFLLIRKATVKENLAQ